MNEIKVSINRNGLLSKYLITDTIDFNKHMHDIDIFINDKWRKYADDFKLQHDLNFTFDQRESEVNLHKATSSPESSSNVSPDLFQILMLYQFVNFLFAINHSLLFLEVDSYVGNLLFFLLRHGRFQKDKFWIGSCTKS